MVEASDGSQANPCRISRASNQSCPMPPFKSAMAFDEYFKLAPGAVSTRLVFVSQSVTDSVWHLADCALTRAMPDGKVFMMALHGDWIYPGEQVDTVLQARLRTDKTHVCEACLKEYELAREIIEQRGLLRFK